MEIIIDTPVNGRIVRELTDNLGAVEIPRLPGEDNAAYGHRTWHHRPAVVYAGSVPTYYTIPPEGMALAIEEDRAAYAARPITPVKSGHAGSCTCASCAREDAEDRSFLRAYRGA